MARTVLALLTVPLLLAGALAGCIDDPSADTAQRVSKGGTVAHRAAAKIALFDEIRTLLADVPCEAPFDATKTTANFKQLANFSFDIDGKKFGSRELDVRGDLVLTTLGGYGGIGLFGISDPLHPEPLSYLKTAGELDVKFTPDNNTALVGTSNGVAIVDIRNPLEMILTSTWKWEDAPKAPKGLPLRNAHMLYTARIAEKDWLFIAPNDNTGVWILEIMGEPGAVKLNFVTNTMVVPGVSSEGGPLGPHDMYVEYDPDLKMWVMYSADGYHGWNAFNINDPSKPVRIGGINKPETGYTHTIQAAKIGGKRYVVTIQEVGANLLEVYDATKIDQPMLVGLWQDNAASVDPQHNFNIVKGRVYMAHYANGIYVFDLDKFTPGPTPKEFKPVAHYGGKAAQQHPAGFSQFYDVVTKDGLVYAASYSQPTAGIHVIGDGCLTPGDESQTSTG